MIRVTYCRSCIANYDIPDFRTNVTLYTTWETVAQISGESSTGSGSGYPGIGATRTTSSEEISCKDGKMCWATASRLYPFVVIAKRAQHEARNWQDSLCEEGSVREQQRHFGSDTSG